LEENGLPTVAGGGGGRPHEQRREKRERKKRERRKKGRALAPVQVRGSHANQIGVIESRHLLWCDSIDTWCFTAELSIMPQQTAGLTHNKY
jgi:hypothetical protein